MSKPRLKAVEGEAEPVEGGAGPLPAIAEVRALEPVHPGAAPAVQAAALAATGFVAGAATIALVRRRATRRAAPARPHRGRRRKGAVEVVGTRSFLVDIHLLDRL